MNMLIEGQDYALVPASESDNDQSWDVRILEGDFAETVIRFGNIAFDGENDCLTFNFMLVSSPYDHITTETVELQDRAGEVLTSILSEAASTGSLVIDSKDKSAD